MDQDMVSFVLRFVREAGEDQQARWRGIIKHVQSNTETSFNKFAEALAFMQTYVNDVVEAGMDETQRMGQGLGEGNPFMETARMLGDMMPRYTQMMMDSMGGASVSEPVEKAMDATFAAWGMPTRSEREQSAASLQTVTSQLEKMTKQMADLEKQLAELQNSSIESEPKENTNE